MIGDRMVSVAIEGGATLVLRCPPWCDGHPYADVPLDPVDVAHESDETALALAGEQGTFEILGVVFCQAPYSGRDRFPYCVVDLGTESVRFTSPQLLALADGLEQHAGVLRESAVLLEEIRAAAIAERRPPGIPDSWPWPPADEDEQ